MTEYCQQSGRVGRDGKLADSIMRELSEFSGPDFGFNGLTLSQYLYQTCGLALIRLVTNGCPCHLLCLMSLFLGTSCAINGVHIFC